VQWINKVPNVSILTVTVVFYRSVVGRYLVERCGVNVDAEEGVFGMELSQPLGEIDGEQFAPLLEAIVAAVKAFFAHCER